MTQKSNRMWEIKKSKIKQTLDQLGRDSPVLTPVMIEDLGDEVRAIALFHTKTLVRGEDGNVVLRGPAEVGVRLHERFLSEAPHPLEIATIFMPRRIFHPNCNAAGALCLGHPAAGLSMDLILHQIWAALTFNMKCVNTSYGEILNRDAAEFVRARAERFPLTFRGLLEEPDDGRNRAAPMPAP